MPNLTIKTLKLRNYRCFPEIELEFHKQLTVLVAANGAGKTSILDAIAVALGPYIGAFDESYGTHFRPSDIRLCRVRDTASNEMEYAAGGVSLEACGYIPGSLGDELGCDDLNWLSWKRTLAGPKKSKTTVRDAKLLIDYGKRMQNAVRTPGTQDVVLPVLAYYGTGRLWQQKKLMSARLPTTSRTTGYTNCLDPASSYKSFAEWFRYWSTNALKGRVAAMEAGSAYVPTEFDDCLESVGGAVNTCLEPSGWKNIRYQLAREELVASHEEHGELPVDLLSDGIRNMIGMVADIAFRATKLNPNLGPFAANQTPGIVLIDEVDMHLHPDWQQHVLTSLTRAFPLVQFIVTTHSPQVLSTVRHEAIRVIGRNREGQMIAEPPLAMTYGEPSGNVLLSVMQVDPQPPVAEKADLQQLTELVDQGSYASEEAQRLMRQLQGSLGNQHPQL